MASDGPARVGWGHEANTNVMEFVPGAAANEPCIPGDFFFLDTGDDLQMKRCQTDPVLIYGISEIDTTAALLLVNGTKVPGRRVTEETKFIMYSDTTPVDATHLGVSYGITRNADGHWLLDIAKTTTASRMVVLGTNIDVAGQEYFICQIHNTVLQYSDLEVATS